MAHPLPARRIMLSRAIGLIVFGVFFVGMFMWQEVRPSSLLEHASGGEFAATGSLMSGKEVASFSPRELADIVTPSVVRVIQHIGGTAALAGFSVDPTSLTFTPAPRQKTASVDAYVSGAGFFVNPEGYALVSARTVSLEGAKQALIARAIEAALPPPVKEPASLPSADEERRTTLKANIARYLRGQSVFHLEQASVIARPSSSEKRVADLFSNGYPLKILSVNEHFLEDGRDVALIHINQGGVPALALSVPAGIETGIPLFIATVPFSLSWAASTTPADSSLTKNKLGSVVQGTEGVATFTTDARLTPDGGGAPMVNESGEVVGMATFSPTPPLAQSGMPLAFMLGIIPLRDELAGRFIIPHEGAYTVAIRKGVALLHTHHCRDALAAFAEARQANAAFFSPDRLAWYEGQCGSLTIGGVSLKLLWEDVRDNALSLSGPARAMVFGGLFVLIILALVVVRLSRKVVADERELHHLKDRLASKKSSQKSIIGAPRREPPPQQHRSSPVFLKPTHFPYAQKKEIPPLLKDTPEQKPPSASPLGSVPLISLVPRELVTPTDALEQPDEKKSQKISEEAMARLLAKPSPNVQPDESSPGAGIISGVDEAIGLERPRDPRLRAMLHRLATPAGGADGNNDRPHHHLPAADALWALPDNFVEERKDDGADIVDMKEVAPPDVDPTLFAYVSDAYRAGMSREMIAEELTRVGWPREAIKRALEAHSRSSR